MFRSKEQEEIYEAAKKAKGVTFINASAGVGKTRPTLKARFEKDKKFLYAVPTIHLMEQLLASEDLKVTKGGNTILPFYSKKSLGEDEYAEQKEKIAKANMVICTHAMLIRDLMIGGAILDAKQYDCIVFDEADKLPSAASLQKDGLIPLSTMQDLNANDPMELYNALCLIKEPSDDEKYYRSLAKKMTNSDDRFEYGIVRRTSRGMEIKYNKPANIVSKLFYDNINIIMLSATLAIGDDFSFFEHSVGLFDSKKFNISPKEFGQLDFVLSKRVIEKGKLHEYWVKGIKAIAHDTNILVLVPSYKLATSLHKEVGGMLHEKGERIDHVLARYSGGLLISPCAWEGMDTEHKFSHLVIPKIPFSPPDEVLDISYLSLKQMAMRKMIQGIGRVLRSPEDKATVYVLDPRFPLPDSKVRLEGERQYKAKYNIDFYKVIPSRFRKGRNSVFQKATIY